MFTENVQTEVMNVGDNCFKNCIVVIFGEHKVKLNDYTPTKGPQKNPTNLHIVHIKIRIDAMLDF